MDFPVSPSSFQATIINYKLCDGKQDIDIF